MRRQRGNAMIEFALSVGVLVPLFLGTFQFGYTFYIYDILSTQMRSGARYASMRAFTCKDAASITDFKTATKNMVLYGNPDGTGSVIAPGLTAGMIDVQIKDRLGANADKNSVPAYVAVTTLNYNMDAVVRKFNFNNKPYVYFPYVGRYAPEE